VRLAQSVSAGMQMVAEHDALGQMQSQWQRLFDGA
jgi:hypothetical protein